MKRRALFLRLLALVAITPSWSRDKGMTYEELVSSATNIWIDNIDWSSGREVRRLVYIPIEGQTTTGRVVLRHLHRPYRYDLTVTQYDRLDRADSFKDNLDTGHPYTRDIYIPKAHAS